MTPRAWIAHHWPFLALLPRFDLRVGYLVAVACRDSNSPFMASMPLGSMVEDISHELEKYLNIRCTMGVDNQ